MSKKPDPLTVQDVINIFNHIAKTSPHGRNTLVYINIAPGVDYQVPKISLDSGFSLKPLEADPDNSIVVIQPDDDYTDCWNS